MARRTRASRSAHRPGGQGPSRTKKSDGDAASADADAKQTTDADIDAAVETVTAEYTELAIEEAAPAAAPTKRRRTRRSARAQAESLEGRAAAENVFVRADLRRIGMISVILLTGLLVAWIVFVVMDVLSLY